MKPCERLAPSIEPLEARIAPSYTATLGGATAAFVGTAAGDTITFSVSGGFLTHNRVGDGGFASSLDFDSAVAGVQMLAVSAASTVSVNTGGGNDTVNIGTLTVPASSLLASFVVSNSGQDGDTLNIDDRANATGININITSTRVTGFGIDVSRGGDGYNGGVIVRTGSGADTVNVTSVPSDFFIEPTQIFTDGGDDTINIDSSSNSLDTFGQGITVDAGPGTDRLTIIDSADTSDNTYTITATSFTRPSTPLPVGPFQFSAALENLVVNAGSGNDTFIVTASANTELTINAGSGGVVGDTLNYDSPGAVATRTPATGEDGTITAAGFADVNFDDVENTLINLATWDGGGANSLWTTAQNWLGDVAPNAGDMLVFPTGAARLSNTNDFPDGTLFASLIFTGLGYAISEQVGAAHGIDLAAGITFDVTASSGNAAIIDVPITLTADQTFLNIGTRPARLDVAVNLNGQDLAVDGSGNINIAGDISGTGSITKNGTGTLFLGGNSTFTGPVQINSGFVEASSGLGLGASSPGSATTVMSGATLLLRGNGVVVPEPIVVSGSGVSGFGALLFNAGTGATLAGAVTLAGDTTIRNANPGSTLILSGPIGEEAPGRRLTKIGSGLVVLADVNTYTGGTSISEGALRVDGVTGDVMLAGGTLSGTGTVGAIDAQPGGAVAPGNPTGPLTSAEVALTAATTLNVLFNGTALGAFDQLNVTGNVTLGGAVLQASLGFTPAIGDSFVIIANDGQDPIDGAFAGLREGAIFSADGSFLRIHYAAGDGNDVVLTAVAPSVVLSAKNRTATYIDVDGDVVKITTNRGEFGQDDFALAFVVRNGVVTGSQLQRINFSDDSGEFAGASIRIAAKRGPTGGDGFVNVGAIDSTGSDLGNVVIGGDLGQIDAGDGDTGKPALGSLTVHSMGVFGLSTQAAGGSLESVIDGRLGKLAVRTSLRDARLSTFGGPEGDIGSMVIGGSIVGGASFQSGSIRAEGDIGPVKIGGDLRGGNGTDTGAIVAAGNLGPVQLRGSLFGGAGLASGLIASSGGAIKSLSIGGSVFGGTAPFISAAQIGAGTQLGAVRIAGSIHGTASNPVTIFGVGAQVAPVAGIDVAIKSLTVGGNVEFLVLAAGYAFSTGTGINADAAVGAIKIGGDLLSSILVAGVDGGADGIFGTGDDVKLSGVDVRDNADITSRIASVTVKGQLLGTPDTVSSSDGFGIIAEQIGLVRTGVVKLPLTAGVDVLALGTTGDFVAREDV